VGEAQVREDLADDGGIVDGGEHRDELPTLQRLGSGGVRWFWFGSRIWVATAMHG